MEKLCTDILENILFRLPVDAAIQAKRVCTTWRAIIRNKTEKPGGFLFAHYHLQPHCNNLKHLFYEDEYDHDVHSKTINYYSDNNFIPKIDLSRSIPKSILQNVMVGSCNGLVCFGKDSSLIPSCPPFKICNPLTGEVVFLPGFNSSGLPEDIPSTRKPYGRSVSGFGYCPSTNDYKVVSILYPKEEEEEERGHVHVYTLGTGKWRYIGLTGHRRVFNNFSSGIYANGALFWLHKGNSNEVQESEIVAFDLKGDKFHYIALPHSEDFEYRDNSSSPLNLLGGNYNLYLVHSIFTGLGYRTDIWIYKKDNRNNILSHWLKEFSIELGSPYFATPFAITRSNAVLWYGIASTSLYYYDPKTSTVYKLRDDIPDNGTLMKFVYIEAVPHMQSIVSLKDLGEANVTFLKDL